jgi:hypothetical protein
MVLKNEPKKVKRKIVFTHFANCNKKVTKTMLQPENYDKGDEDYQ